METVPETQESCLLLAQTHLCLALEIFKAFLHELHRICCEAVRLHEETGFRG